MPITTEAFIDSVMRSHHLDKPDGRMLFGYRLSAGDFAILRDLMASELAPDTWGQVRVRGREACALFVLYAAEWWKREYSGGPWRWREVLEALGQGVEHLEPEERTAAVELGLRFWGHRPSSDGKRYFGSIVAHGGLPMRVVERGAGAISGLLTRGLQLAHQFSWTEEHLTEFFAENDDLLVPHLRKSEIHRLFSGIVTTVLALREEFKLAGVEQPTRKLDELEPDWRTRFALSVDDNAAERLLLGLVREAASAQVRTAGFPIVVDRHLEQSGDGGFELRSQVQFVRAMGAGVLADAAGIELANLPRYFSVDVRTMAGRDRMCQGRQLLNSEPSAVVLEGRSAKRNGLDAASDHMLILSHVHGDLGAPTPLPGGVELDLEMPWAFVRRGDRWMLTAIGACRLPDDTALLALPTGAVAEPAEVLEPYGTLSCGKHQFSLLMLRGSAAIRVGDDSYRVRTSQTVQAPDQFVWLGKRLNFPSQPLPVFLGVPMLYRFPEGGTRRRVAPGELQWRVLGSPTRQIVDPKSHRGPVEVWLLEQGERQLRFRFVLESPTAQVLFSSGADECNGAAALVGWSATSVAAAAQLAPRIEVAAGSQRLTFQSVSPPPATAEVDVLWPGCAWPVTLILPFPSSGGRFFDGEGKVIAKGATLTLGRFTSLRARVFDRNPNNPKRYTLTMVLKPPTRLAGARGLYRSIPFKIDAHGVGELRLLDVKDLAQGLLAQCDELDAYVEMAIQAGGSPIYHVQVSRYDAGLSKDGSAYLIDSEDVGRIASDDLGMTSMLAVPLLPVSGEPTLMAQLQSEGVPCGRWNVQELAADKGSWLLYPSAGSKVQFRPTLHRPVPITEGGWVKLDGLCPLGQAMEEGQQQRRQQMIQEVVAEMAHDFDHGSWRLLGEHLRNLRHLPLSTLDPWRQIAKNQAAALASVLKFPDLALELTHRLQDELGVIWELTSVRQVREAAVRLRRHWANLAGEAESSGLIRGLVDSQLERLCEALPSICLIVDIARFEAGLNNVPPAVLQLQREMHQSTQRIFDALWRSGQNSMGQQLLLRAHSDDALWPNFRLSEQLRAALVASLSPAASNALMARREALFWIPPIRAKNGESQEDPRADAANVPAFCAVWAMSDLPCEVWQAPESAFAVRQIRAFDPFWFEEAYRQACKVCKSIEIEGVKGAIH